MNVIASPLPEVEEPESSVSRIRALLVTLRRKPLDYEDLARLLPPAPLH